MSRAAATLEARVAALERLVRALAPAAGPARVSRAAAALLLCCSATSVKRYAARGLLVPLPKPEGAPACARAYFHPDNVAALARGEAEAEAWIARRRFVPKSRRI
jgi:hypothetical protein